jgi:hypothetical protein
VLVVRLIAVAEKAVREASSVTALAAVAWPG